MDIYKLLSVPIQIFSLPPEILSVIKLRQNSIGSSTKLISETTKTTKIKEIDIFTKQNKNNDDLMKPTCFVCGITSFDSVEQQRAHYKLDWHRFNVKRRAVNLEYGKSQYKPTTEEEFEELIGDSLSSISGSETEDSDATDDNIATLVNKLEEKVDLEDDELSEYKVSEPILWFTCPHLFPITINLGIYKNILSNFEKKAIDDIRKFQIKSNEENPRLWTMLMIRGGHFAALILDITINTKVTHAKEVKAIVHKTFHRYTTRRKQGGSQASNDNAKGKAKSAGAELRRYNEAVLQKSIRALIEQWKSMIEESELIFVHAPSYNKNIIYNYEGAILRKDDKRIRSFPFSTKRPTFTELRKSYIELTRVKMLEIKDNDDSNESLLNNKLTEKNLKNSQIIIESIEESIESAESVKSSNKLEQASNEIIKMIQFIKKGKLSLFENHITKHSISVTDFLPSTPISENDISKSPTLLHLASYFGHHDIVEYLLYQGADPTIISEKNLTPYDLAKDKETRNIFRRYMAEHMDKWDWSVAHVPSPLTKEMEEEQHNKQKEKKKKNKEKKKKATSNKKEKELVESEGKIVAENIESKSESKTSISKKLTLNKTIDSSSSLIGLPPEMRMRIERERRARAAETRINSMQNRGMTIGNVVCAMCGKSLSELVPFEMFGLKFCSIECVRNHRESTGS
ncbi:hypothetical protein C1645_764109 [Glomus cerebriforme]|uniref:VLRF1 domain-containing protein n=1 Tax=Glomus cerebriforme TaxID=658196 RepID=A0A397T915_9GLOM|nr:hypothetical protein C1645_764109 [Glomus cerebriforme]